MAGTEPQTGRSRAELEAELLSLRREVEALRAGTGRKANADTSSAEVLHNLQVYQEELKAQNEHLRETQEHLESVSHRYRDLFEYSPVGYFIIDASLAIVDANMVGTHLLERERSRLVNRPFSTFVDWTCRRDFEQHVQQVRSDGRAGCELRLLPEGKAPRPVLLESVRFGDGTMGEPWRCLTTATDITGRKRIEDSLTESEGRFRAIFEQSPLAIQILGADGVPRRSNRAWMRLWGAGADSLDADGRHPVLDRIGIRPQLAGGLAGEGQEIPATHVKPDTNGESANRWIHGYVYPIRLPERPVGEVVLVHEDISEHKLMELALADGTARLRRQYGNLRVLGEIAALPPDGAAQRLVNAMALARGHLGLRVSMISHIENNRFSIDYHETDDDRIVPLSGKILDLDRTYSALVLERNDVVAISHMSQSPFANHPCFEDLGLESYIGAPVMVSGRLHGTLSFAARDPMERPFDDGDVEFMRLLARWAGGVLQEDAIRRDLAQSNAELEQFAYVASHDLRQPLRQVSSYVSLLQRRYGDKLDDNAKEFITFARDGAQRMDHLIVDLLEFSRIGHDPKPMGPVPLGEVIRLAISHLGTAITESGGQVEVAPDLPMVMGDPQDLTRLFQNLMGNAIKYSCPNRPPVVTVTATPGTMGVVVTIQDNGIGIGPEYFETIFGIFKRLHTPDRYEGTGIGLAICKKVVERHHGRIWVESVPDEGSAFHVELPRAD